MAHENYKKKENELLQVNTKEIFYWMRKFSELYNGLTTTEKPISVEPNMTKVFISKDSASRKARREGKYVISSYKRCYVDH